MVYGPSDSAPKRGEAGPFGAGSGVPRTPTPTLPKGGGAISGIGEKFTANAATGTASLSIPIAASPGRDGFDPKLGLAYDSGSGDGVFGLGLSLGMPSIARKTDKGLPRYLDADESDVFLLSGAEDLVPVLEKSGQAWTRARETRGDERIDRYRPRVEGLFARIERHTVLATGEAYWTATTKENVTSVYGRSVDARIADPADPLRIFQWLLEETRDARGNIIRYAYKKETREGVEKAFWEKDRSPPANRYLKRVQYGNLDREATRFAFQIVFDYGEHDEAVPTPEEVKP